MSFASRREGEGVEFEEGEGSGFLADRGQGTLQGTLKHLIQFELSKKESPLKEAVVEVRRMQALRGWGLLLRGRCNLIKDAACCRVAGLVCEMFNVCRPIRIENESWLVIL